MSIFSKFIDSMKITEDEDEVNEFYDDEDEIEEEKTQKTSLFGRKSEPVEEEDEEEETISRNRTSVAKKTSVPVRKKMEVSMVKPTSVEDSKEITEFLLLGKAVVLNMEGIHTELAQRIIDFTSGATYSIGGKMQKISNYIFIATPPSVELSGEFQDLLNSISSDGSGFGLRK